MSLRQDPKTGLIIKFGIREEREERRMQEEAEKRYSRFVAIAGLTCLILLMIVQWIATGNPFYSFTNPNWYRK